MAEPLFNVGDFVTNEESVFMLIVSVIPGEPPVYAVSHIKQSDHLHWLSEYDLLDHGFKRNTPKFAAFQAIKVGDIIVMGNDSYMKVLARVGDAVLLSQPPDEGASMILNILRTSKEQGVDPPVPDEAKEQLRNAASMHKAYRRAGAWHDVRTLALMNWRIVRDEH